MINIIPYESYELYKQAQVEANLRKLNKVFAQRDIIRCIAQWLQSQIPQIEFGICHGARNGTEVKWFREFLYCEVIGTDISSTANNFEHMVEWDFHKGNEAWLNKCDFIYSNALDHSYDPYKALTTWKECLTTLGYLIIEWSPAHNKQSLADPFAGTIEDYRTLLGASLRHEISISNRVLFVASKQ